MKNLLMIVPLLIIPTTGIAQERAGLSGTFSPVGPPVNAPERVDAGPTCIVDLVQRYEVRGDLTGRMEIDFRILVHGPCGAPAGTYDEEWIAHGVFDGSLNREPASGSFAYTADVKSGGEVKGTMAFGGGIEGALTIVGKFSDEELSYSGALQRAQSPATDNKKVSASARGARFGEHASHTLGTPGNFRDVSRHARTAGFELTRGSTEYYTSVR